MECEQWEFFQGQDGRWRWRCYKEDGSFTESQHSFQSRVDCIAQAMSHGYLSTAGLTTRTATKPPSDPS